MKDFGIGSTGGKTMIKKITCSLILLLSVTGTSAAGLSLGIGGGTEKINQTLTVDLYQVQGIYRFNSNIMAGAMIQMGYPKNNNVTSETRKEIIIGYGNRLNKAFPYVFLSHGERDRKSISRYDYYTVKVGSKFLIHEKFYIDTSYRYRDTDNADWRTQTYFFGIGYNVSPGISIQIQYGDTHGSFDSSSTSVFFINRF